MKKIFFTITILIISLGSVFSQSNSSDIHTPPVVPPPPPKKDSCKLLGFTLPCCIDTVMSVASIASVTVDKQPCPVKFNPTDLSPNGFLGNSVQTVTATAGGVSKTAAINVVNTNKSLGFTPIQINFGKAPEKFVNMVGKVFGKIPYFSCEPSMKPFSGNGGYDVTYMCCPGRTPCVRNSLKGSGSLNAGLGVKCAGKPGIPYLGEVKLIVSIGLQIGVKFNFQTGCDSSKWCAGVEAKLSVGGGVGGEILGGGGSLDAQLVVSGSGSGTYCSPPGNLCLSVNLGQVSIVGTAELFWGWTTQSFEYVIFDGWTFNLGCF